MSYSNETPNLHLPQWTGSDKPTYLVDQNGAYDKIDDFAGETNDALQQLDNELDTIAGRVTTIEGKQSTDEDNIAGLQSQVGAIQTTVGSIAGVIDNLVHDINEVQSEMDTLEGAVDTLTDTTIPAIQTQATTTENQLSSDGTAQGTKFYFDIKNGVAGYNTSAARGADTFSPFNAGGIDVTIGGFKPIFLLLDYGEFLAQNNTAISVTNYFAYNTPPKGAIRISVNDILTSLNTVYGVTKTAGDLSDLLAGLKTIYDTIAESGTISTLSNNSRGFILVNFPVRLKDSIGILTDASNLPTANISLSGELYYGKTAFTSRGAAIINNDLILRTYGASIMAYAAVASTDYAALDTPINYLDGLGNTETSAATQLNYRLPDTHVDNFASKSICYILPSINTNNASNITAWVDAAKDSWNDLVDALTK